jgi:hypothetical protein
MKYPWLLALLLPMSGLRAEPIDDCASLLGSIAVELRYAHALPPGTRTTFVCPRDAQALLGASKQRILRALGTPDAAGPAEDPSVNAQWSYVFAGARAGEPERGVPVLSFSFDQAQQVTAVTCAPRH